MLIAMLMSITAAAIAVADRIDARGDAEEAERREKPDERIAKTADASTG